MELNEPHKVYTAESNLDAHLIVNMLVANGIAAYAEEDQSGVSLWSFGRISQFHQPNVWVEKSSSRQAAELIRQFEAEGRKRRKPGKGTREIKVVCEDCGKTTLFPDTQEGTTQDCSHCGAYVDVGELDWDPEFGEPES